MSYSLSKLLLLHAQQFEDQHAPQNVTLALREASTELDLLAILATDREEYLQLLTDENNKLRSVLQRVRRWGSPMVKGYIDGALGGQAGGSDPLADDQVGSVGEQGGAGMSEIVDRLRLLVPSDSSGAAFDGVNEITRLTAEVERLNSELTDALTDLGTARQDNASFGPELKHLTAEVAEYESMFDAQWNADMAGVQMWREAHPGNDMVLPDRKRFTAWILAEIVVQRVENEKLRAALRECEAELNAYYRMKYPGDHPHSQKELAQAMASNPATVALKEKP